MTIFYHPAGFRISACNPRQKRERSRDRSFAINNWVVAPVPGMLISALNWAIRVRGLHSEVPDVISAIVWR